VTDPGPPQALCAICQSPIVSGEETSSCPECAAVFHGECWEENGGCAVYGCSRVPETQPLEGVEIPASHWGQDDKPCPACRATILAAAVRCRHCGAEFSTARELHRVEYTREQRRKERLPEHRRNVALLVIFSLFSCTAPLALVVGGIWFRGVRVELSGMPGVYAGLSRVALAVAGVQTVFIGLMTVAYAVFRG